MHAAGLVHRDIKAQNVLRDRSGRVVLGDFGTGRELDEANESPGGLAGTPPYLAPEIFARQRATPQSDLYSLGALLFHLATRQFPVRGRSLRELRDAHSRGERVSLASLRPDLPRALVAVIERALHADAVQRFDHAEAMRRALEDCQPRPGVSFHRSGRLAIAAAALAATTIAGVLLVVRDQRPPALAFAAKDWVLVTAFDNRTGESVLDGALEYALERELSASPFVNVVPPLRVQDTLALMRKPWDTRIDRATGAEIATRDGSIRVLVAGRVERLGARYSITSEIVTPDGSSMGSVHEPSVSEPELLSAISRIAVRVRERLGESLTSIAEKPAPPPQVSTSSLRALHLYQKASILAGEEGGVGMPSARAVQQLLTEALREDPQFPMAHILLSSAWANLQGRVQAVEHAKLALAAAEYATPIERAVALSFWHSTQASYPPFADQPLHNAKAAAALEAVLQLHPDHQWALVCLANIYGGWSGPQMRSASRNGS